jgi:hypothetical protein
VSVWTPCACAPGASFALPPDLSRADAGHEAPTSSSAALFHDGPGRRHAGSPRVDRLPIHPSPNRPHRAPARELSRLVYGVGDSLKRAIFDCEPKQLITVASHRATPCTSRHGAAGTGRHVRALFRGKTRSIMVSRHGTNHPLTGQLRRSALIKRVGGGIAGTARDARALRP